MANRHLRGLTDDEIYARWQERFERVRLELTFLFSVRRKFRQVQAMFTDNKRLNAIGSQAWGWVLLLWGRDAVMAVRRELDDDTNTISLGTLLDEMAARPDVLTRRRYMAHMTGCDETLIHLNDEAFTKRGIIASASDRTGDHLDPAAILADRDGLVGAASPVIKYANLMVAHRSPVEGLEMTVEDIHVALDAMQPVVKKYHVLLSGSALTAIEPTEVGDDWREAFTFAWFDRPQRGA